MTTCKAIAPTDFNRTNARTGHNWMKMLVLVGALIGAATTSTGCADSAQSGALIGAGAGAILGQAIGRNTTGTLIGTGAGALGGYIIGNEMDKGRARNRNYNNDGYYNNNGDSYYRNRDW